MSWNEFDKGDEAATVTLSRQEILKSVVSPVDESLIPIDGISFFLIRFAKAITVRADREFYIGREIPDDLWKPLVNLAELDGFASGVSRQHAKIRPVKNGYEIIDLSSTNGTRLNDQRLLPNKPYPLPNRAHLIVGHERLLVVYHSRVV